MLKTKKEHKKNIKQKADWHKECEAKCFMKAYWQGNINFVVIFQHYL